MDSKKIIKGGILLLVLSTLLATGCIDGCIPTGSYGSLDGYVYVTTGNARISVRGLLEDIKNATYRPLPGATVVIGNKIAITDSNGYFIITRIPVGTYSVSITANGYEPLTIPEVVIRKDQITHLYYRDLPRSRRKWNFLVYLNGDNNLEDYAIRDLNEMEEIGSTNDVNIIVLIDRIPEYNASNGDWTTTRLYYVTKDSDPTTINSILLADLGERDMSDPKTLSDFIIYCEENFPADKTCLTLWDHGGGVYPKAYERERSLTTNNYREIGTRGLSWDDTTGSTPWDCLTTDEVKEALMEARAYTGKKIDVINMDVCLCQMLEIAYEWRDEVDFLVGSEETVPGDGNDYKTILTHLTGNPDMSPKELAKTLVDDFYNYYEPLRYSTTYSYIDLGVPFTDLIDRFRDLASALYNTGDLSCVSNARSSTTSFSFPENLDLYDLADELARSCNDSSVVSTANNLKLAILNAIYYRNTGRFNGTSPAYGIAIMFPTKDEWQYYSGSNQYVALALSRDTLWDEFILRFVQYTP